MSSFDVALDKEVSVKEISKKGTEVTLELTASKELVNKCFHNALLQVQGKAQMQGFRAGKAPLEMVKKNFPGHISERAVDFVVRNAVTAALEKTKLKAVMMPVVSKADFTALQENKPFSFEIKADVAPEFTPKGYSGIEITKKPETVTAEEIEKHLEEILEHNSSLEAAPADAIVTDTNFAVVKYTGSKNGVADAKYSAESELIDMSAPQTVAGLAEAVKGAKKGDTRTFETKADNDVINFTVTVEEIKNKVKPVLDEAFAKNMGFDNVEKLKETVKTSMEKEAKLNSERDITAQIENALVKENTFDLPKSLVEYHTHVAVENFIKRMFAGQKTEFSDENKKAFGERMRPNVEKDLRVGYIIHAIADKENLKATDADLQAEMDKALASNPKEEKRVKEFFDEKKHDILATLDERKVFEFLKAKAKIK